MMTFNGPGNIHGPRTRYVCQRCGKTKAETAFKVDRRNGCRAKTCRACWSAAGRLRSKRTPLHVKRASAMGEGTEGRWGSSRCPECGEAICFDTDGRGGLVALDRSGLGVHRHQQGRQVG